MYCIYYSQRLKQFQAKSVYTNNFKMLEIFGLFHHCKYFLLKLVKLHTICTDRGVPQKFQLCINARYKSITEMLIMHRVHTHFT